MVAARKIISTTNFTTFVNSPLITPSISTQSSQIGQIQSAFQNLNSSVIERGGTYANLEIAMKGGFIAEDWHAGTYNLDATIQHSQTKAYTVKSNGDCSVDVSFNDGDGASLKFCKTTGDSIRAQSKSGYGDQIRVISKDQFEDSQRYFERCGEDSKKIESLVTDRISDGNGVESTPLTTEQAHDLAKAINTDDKGNILVDQKMLDEAYKNTGVTKKVNKAIVKEKVAGIGIATAIGLATGFTIGFITTLAQSGINPSSIKYALISGAKASVESGAVSAASSTLGVTIGSVASKALADSIITRLGESVAETTLKKISDMCNLGVVGAITIVALSVYEFVKLKHMGFSTKESLIRTGKSAALSASVLVLSIVATGIWGTPAGIAVSIVAGVIMTGVTIITTIHDKQLMKQITLHTIKISQPNFA